MFLGCAAGDTHSIGSLPEPTALQQVTMQERLEKAP